MNREEASQFLTLRAAFEPGTAIPGDADVSAWSMVLDDIDLADAKAVLRDHYRESTYPVKPADIVARVRRLRSGRVRDWETAGGTEPVPPVDPDDTARTIAWTRAFRHAIGSGATTDHADAFACRAVGVQRPPSIPAVPRPALLAALGSVTKRPPAAE